MDKKPSVEPKKPSPEAQKPAAPDPRKPKRARLHGDEGVVDWKNIRGWRVA